MALGCMHFRAPHAELKQKAYHNSPNMQPIMISFQVTVWIFFQINLTCFVFVIGVLHFSCFVFIFLNFQRHAFLLCVKCDKTK